MKFLLHLTVSHTHHMEMSEPKDTDFDFSDDSLPDEARRVPQPRTDDELLRQAQVEHGKKIGELERRVDTLSQELARQGRLVEACRRMIRRITQWIKLKG
jgi:hypothetical protein